MVDEMHRRPEDEQLRKWVGDLHDEYGDIKNWPKIGCGATFVPWRAGRSQVVHIMSRDGVLHAFSAERMPEQLDNAIKAKKAE